MDDEMKNKSIDDMVTYYDEPQDAENNGKDTEIEPEEEITVSEPKDEYEPEQEEDKSEPKEEPEGEYESEPAKEPEGGYEPEPAKEPEGTEKSEPDNDFENDDEPEYYDDYDEYYEYSDDYDDIDDDIDDEYRISTKTLTVIAVIVVLIALAGVLSFVDGGIVGQYKANAVKNISSIAYKLGIGSGSNEVSETNSADGENVNIEYGTDVKYIQSVPVDNAGAAQFKKYKDGLLCATANNIMFIDSLGNIAWESDTVIVNPILKTGGNYILLIEKNGKRMCLYNETENIYDITVDDKILNCSVSANGDVVAVTDKAGYKGAVTVYNRSGDQIFSWSSGSDNVISADISAKSRRVAATLLNSDGQAKSSVKVFDIKKADALRTIIFEDTILFDVKFSGDTANVFGDNSMVGISSGGKLLFDKRFDGARLIHYSSDDGNHMMLFESANMPLINVYNRKGRLKDQFTAEAMPDVIDVCEDYVAYNSGRTIISGRADTKDMTRFNADLDIKHLFLVDEKTFMIVYSNSVEIVTME